MASTTKAGQLKRQAAGARAGAESPAPDLRLDWIMSLSSCAIVFGLYIDGWAHNHGRVDDSFFTPWHALLYGSVAFAGLALILTHFRNVSRGYRWAKALPAGYALSLIGFFGFGAGGVVDLIWHEAFGFEESIEALISPSHLLLALTGLLIMTGPIRSFWKRESDGSWASMAPIVLCFTAVTSVFTFFNAYAPIGGDLIVLTGTRPDPHTLQDVAVIMPFSYSLGVMLVTHILGASVWGSGGLWWLIHMWLGVPVLAGAFGYGLSLLMRPPAHTD